jgi:hypothetical protein
MYVPSLPQVVVLASVEHGGDDAPNGALGPPLQLKATKTCRHE